MPDLEDDDMLLAWGNPSCSRTTYEFSQARESDLDLDCELSEDCSIPGPGVVTLSAVIEQQNTGNHEFLAGGEADWAKLGFVSNVVAQRSGND